MVRHDAETQVVLPRRSEPSFEPICRMSLPFLATTLLAVIALGGMSSARGASMSASSTAPVIDGGHRELRRRVRHRQMVPGNGGARGQSITTGGAAVRLKSITYQVSEATARAHQNLHPARRQVAGTNFTQVHSETATQNFSWTSGQYMTWTFTTPVLLEPYTTYGIDVGMTSSTSAWQTGIPYINVTADDYAGGTSYSSGATGIGTTSISSAIASDRTFHLDIERPLGPVFSLVSPSPADNATDVYRLPRDRHDLQPERHARLRKPHHPKSHRQQPDHPRPPTTAASPTIRTSSRINPAGLLTWNKNYAIRIDAGLFLGDAAAPIAGDHRRHHLEFHHDRRPIRCLSAIAAIKAHVNNTAPLTGPQISAHKTTIDNQRQRLAESTTTINAVFDLITTYDTVKGPLFVSGFANNSTSFDRNVTTGTAKNSINPENYHWVIYTVMQHAMDLDLHLGKPRQIRSHAHQLQIRQPLEFPRPLLPPPHLATPTPSPSTAASPTPSAATPRCATSPPANPPAPTSRPAPSPPSPCLPRW